MQFEVDQSMAPDYIIEEKLYMKFKRIVLSNYRGGVSLTRSHFLMMVSLIGGCIPLQEGLNFINQVEAFLEASKA